VEHAAPDAVTDPTGTVHPVKIHAYVAPCAVMTVAEQTTILATCPELDATMPDDAPGGAGWARIVVVTRPGDAVVIARVGVLGDTWAEIRERIAEVEQRGGRVDVIVASIPERIALRGTASRWCADQTGR
jgi:hypothetical protein